MSDKWNFLYNLSSEELAALIAQAEQIQEERATRGGAPPDETDDFFNIEEEDEEEEPEEEEDQNPFHDDYEDFEEREDELEDEFEEPPDQPEVYSPDDFDPRDIRKVRYAEPEDAFNYIAERGLQGYASVVFFANEGTWGLVFPRQHGTSITA